MIGKTIKGVIGDPCTPCMISTDDGRVYSFENTKDPYENWDRVQSREIKGLELYNLDHNYKLDLNLITQEECDILNDRQEQEWIEQSKQREINKLKAKEIKSRLTDEEYNLLKEFINLL